MEFSQIAKAQFTKQLTTWHANDNNRDLPWKSEKDPYKIWFSEVILQQTRALQALPYYLRFMETYPTITDMANAPDDDVFRMWQGLGYYNRCKNMLGTARIVAHEYNGKFPIKHEDIINLKGIGPYTAAAIASFAFGLPHAVVDGNVNRVLSRYFGIDTPYDTTEGKKLFAGLAQELLDTQNSAAYNQAIMDLGATVCTPRNTQCNQCPLQKNCVAFHQSLVDVLPVKVKKITVKKRYFNYILLEHDGSIWIEKRTGNDIWENLHEPILIETPQQIEAEELKHNIHFTDLGLKDTLTHYKGSSTQRLTHQLIYASFYSIALSEKPDMADRTGNWLDTHQLKKTAFPKTVVSFLENNLYF